MFRKAALMIAVASVVGAHDIITTNITWTKEVSRLLYKRCATCHGENASIPSMGGGALMTYEQARPWAKDIKEEVLERRMPPWQAVKGFGEFKDDRAMTQEDMEVISAWVEGGAPEGNPKFLPDKPKPAKWLDPAAPAGAAEIEKGAGERLSGSENVVAVRPEGLKKGTSVQIIAARPDGTFEPLLWIYKFNPDFARTYYYESPVALPAGTRIEMSPPDAGKIALFAKHSPSKLKSSTGGGR